MPVFEYHLHPHIPTFAWPFPFRSQAYFLSPYRVSRSFYPHACGSFCCSSVLC